MSTRKGGNFLDGFKTCQFCTEPPVNVLEYDCPSGRAKNALCWRCTGRRLPWANGMNWSLNYRDMTAEQIIMKLPKEERVSYYVVDSPDDLPEPGDVPVGCFAKVKGDDDGWWRNQSLGRGWKNLRGTPAVDNLNKRHGIGQPDEDDWDFEEEDDDEWEIVDDAGEDEDDDPVIDWDDEEDEEYVFD